MSRNLEKRVKEIRVEHEGLAEFYKVYFTGTSEEIRDYVRKNPENRKWFKNVENCELVFGLAVMAGLIFRRDYIGKCLCIAGGIVAEDSLERYKEEARREMMNEENIEPQPGLIGRVREYLANRAKEN